MRPRCGVANRIDWNESDGHEGSWLPSGAEASAKKTQSEIGSAIDEEGETPKLKPLTGSARDIDSEHSGSPPNLVGRSESR